MIAPAEIAGATRVLAGPIVTPPDRTSARPSIRTPRRLKRPAGRFRHQYFMPTPILATDPSWATRLSDARSRRQPPPARTNRPKAPRSIRVMTAEASTVTADTGARAVVAEAPSASP